MEDWKEAMTVAPPPLKKFKIFAAGDFQGWALSDQAASAKPPFPKSAMPDKKMPATWPASVFLHNSKGWTLSSVSAAHAQSLQRVSAMQLCAKRRRLAPELH